MRQAIRTAWQDGFARIAVVCGAWQSPALAEPGSEKADAEHLASLRHRADPSLATEDLHRGLKPLSPAPRDL